MDQPYVPLFQPLNLRCGLRLENRIAMAPMTTWSSHQDGTIHEDELPYIARRAGGLAMVMTAACYVDTTGHAFDGQWGCHDEAMLPSLRRVADLLHSCGTLAILQLHHGGRLCPAALLGHTPLSASAVRAERPDADLPRAMEKGEITATIAAFGEATRRAVETGFDGVEIHGANGYLLQQFFSPHANRRSDEWGGSLEQRRRFPLEVTREVIRRAAQSERPFAVGYRISPEESENPGITLDDTLNLVEALLEFPLDWLHVSVRDYRKPSHRNPHDLRRPTRVVIDRIAGRIPVIGVGKVHYPEDALFLLQDGCDIVALGRILLTEPDWLSKVQTGSARTIRRELPVSGGAKELTLPVPLYARLLSVKGWLPLRG